MYVGGSFTIICNIVANNIAKWNRTSWSALGSGIQSEHYFPPILSLFWNGQNLFVGGRFKAAGNKSSYNIAQWRPCYVSPSTPEINSIDENICSDGVKIYFTEGTPNTRNDLYVGNILKVKNVSSPFTYTPQDNLEHSYKIRSIYLDEQCFKESSPVNATDINLQPSKPVIDSINDLESCNYGLNIFYTPSSGATGYDLYKDNELVVSDFASGSTYIPSDSQIHSYFIRARNDYCYNDSVSVNKADINDTPKPVINGPYPACINALLSTQQFDSYQWYRNGYIINGATSQTYYTLAPGNYTVRTCNYFGCNISPPFLVGSYPSKPVIYGNDYGCEFVNLTTGNYETYQWLLNDEEIQGAIYKNFTATETGTYKVRVGNSAGCTSTSSGKYVKIGLDPPVIDGEHINIYSDLYVFLSTGNYSSYQWLFNGEEIAGAVNKNYYATVTGNYSVTVKDSYNCEATSDNFVVFVDFCENSEVSPQNGIYHLKISKDIQSSTGYYIYFQRIDSVDGYNIYEGEIGNWYSHSNASGNVCGALADDLGTGQMRSELNPSSGNRYYLITAFQGLVEGPSNFDSNGVEILDSQNTCFP